jgi:MerR family copper efflux transcriptional regulator
MIEASIASVIEEERAMTDERQYRVGELAHLCEVNPRTIDYYTTEGLLIPASRSQGGHRFYAESAVQRLRVIKTLQAQGLSLEAIKERLAMPGIEVDLLPRVEHLRSELRRLEDEVSTLTPQLASTNQKDERSRIALQASVAAAATYALTLAQELMNLLNRGLLG